MGFDFDDEFNKLIDDARSSGADSDEIISAFELKLMALREEAGSEGEGE